MAGLLAGMRCLIVGGTTGIGFSAARRFLEEGARLAVTGLDTDESCQGVVALSEYGKVWSADWDGVDVERLDFALRSVVEILGGLDVLYHVAGGSGRKHGDGPLHECSDAGWQATLDMNLRSVFLTNRAAVQHFLGNRQPGAILNMGSVLPLSPPPCYFATIAYTAAKGGIIAMSRLAAARYAADGIRVNVIAPGLIDTPMSTRACGDPAIVEYLRTKQPLAGGPGRPEDCNDVA